MDRILVKPGITPEGFQTAVKDYGEGHVYEELAANSYDADASTVLVLLDDKKNVIHVIDDGRGFNRAAIQRMTMLGGGDKSGAEYSQANRHYLGAYGFGLKSTINIARSIRIETASEDGHWTGEIDWGGLHDALKPEFEGFPFQGGAGKSSHGTWIELRLKQSTKSIVLETILRHLSNLPDDSGQFKCYCGLAGDFPGLSFDKISEISKIAEAAASRGKCQLASASTEADLSKCKVSEAIEGDGSQQVGLKFFFAGIRDGKVQPLKRGLRGIYVRIHGRLLKHDFTTQEYTYSISKWTKFASGLRVEVSADWLRSEITLAREGVRFTNDVLRDVFKQGVQRGIGKFIRQHLATLEKKAAKEADKKEAQRLELARKRCGNDKSVRVDGLEGGFVYRPETDGELALVVAQPGVVTKVNSAYVLIDYNDQAPYDCLLWDRSRDCPVPTELEPALTDFLAHRDSSGVELVITWTLGKWRTGASKKGKEGHWKLLANDSERKGFYKLAFSNRANSKSPSRHVEVVVLEELLNSGEGRKGKQARASR